MLIEGENFTTKRFFTPFLIDNVTTKTVMNFFNNRCFEPSRPGKKKLLDRLGLDAYDSLEIVKKTHFQKDKEIDNIDKNTTSFTIPTSTKGKIYKFICKFTRRS